ncbi:MAG: hypothetical protein U9N35_01655 [Euryarchaeota archaeon]|nr:hypothetical protein [Euryarchaeota archaeon]
MYKWIPKIRPNKIETTMIALTKKDNSGKNKRNKSRRMLITGIVTPILFVIAGSRTSKGTSSFFILDT